MGEERLIDIGAVRVLVGLLVCGGVALSLEWLLVKVRFSAYFRAGFPLAVSPLPIATRPEGEGTTTSVVWKASDAGDVHYWSEAHLDGSVWGLHGLVRFHRRSGNYLIQVRWSPPWTPFILLGAFIVWGITMGSAHILGPVCLGSAMMLMAVYHRAAVRAAAELRWSFVKSEDPI